MKIHKEGKHESDIRKEDDKICPQNVYGYARF